MKKFKKILSVVLAMILTAMIFPAGGAAKAVTLSPTLSNNQMSLMIEKLQQFPVVDSVKFKDGATLEEHADVSTNLSLFVTILCNGDVKYDYYDRNTEMMYTTYIPNGAATGRNQRVNVTNVETLDIRRFREENTVGYSLSDAQIEQVYAIIHASGRDPVKVQKGLDLAGFDFLEASLHDGSINVTSKLDSLQTTRAEKPERRNL